MRVAVTDTETTGLSPEDQVVELAIADTEGNRWSSLVRPTCLVSTEARAVHHISDAMLESAPSMAEILEGRGLEEYAGDAVFVAHNAEFDRRMLLQSGVPEKTLPARTICTWRCALHLWPEAPRHSNQVLRYYLGLSVVESEDSSPHRALPDVAVTLALLERMLLERSIEELIELTERPALLYRVYFGKYRGSRWQDLEPGYLRWILSKDFDEDVKHTARHWLRELGQ